MAPSGHALIPLVLPLRELDPVDRQQGIRAVDRIGGLRPVRRIRRIGAVGVLRRVVRVHRLAALRRLCGVRAVVAFARRHAVRWSASVVKAGDDAAARADDWERLRRRARVLLVAVALALGVVIVAVLLAEHASWTTSLVSGLLGAAAVWGVGAWLVDRTIDGAIEDERQGR